MKYYTGIGSRDTPQDVLSSMYGLAKYLANEGLILRSGAADGADTAFENGCDEVNGIKQIYLPWKNFNKHPSGYYNISTRAYEIAEDHHPRWNQLKPSVQKLIARNTNQIFGDDGKQQRSLFIVCWTPFGKITGGTGQALRIAQAYSIPVFNFGNQTNKVMQKGILDIIEKSNKK